MEKVILIPAFNEQGSILQVISEINSLKIDIDIVVIDDGSTDLTKELVLSANARCISHPINCGVGASLITGLTWAELAGYEQVVIVDADGQHPIESVITLLDSLRDADLVVGCRDWDEYTSTKGRKYAHALLKNILRIKFGICISDVTSGFRAMNMNAVKSLIPTLGDQYLEDTIMLLIEAKKAKLQIVEVPVFIRNRQAGEPSHGILKSGVRYLSVLTKVLLATKGDKYQ